MPRSADLPQVKEVFDNEVEFLKSADHPNIIKLYGYNDEATVVDSEMNIIPVYTIELEHAAHGELFDIISSTGKFSEKEARFYFKQLLEVIEYIHSQGYSHRDIKAENIFLDSEFNLKLADFGFSSNNDWFFDKAGTVGYMAPEIQRYHKHSGKTDDLYAAAVVLFMMMFDGRYLIRLLSYLNSLLCTREASDY
jgi:serine/threonine protein kinase